MSKRLLLMLSLSVTLVPASYAEDVYRDCSNLVTGYAYYRDQFDADKFADLFTEDASLTVLSNTWVGRDKIRERIKELDDSDVIRHLMSTIHIEPVDELHATGISYATIYSVPEGTSSVEGFVLIGEYHDNFVLTEDGWKIQKRELKPILSYEDK